MAIVPFCNPDKKASCIASFIFRLPLSRNRHIIPKFIANEMPKADIAVTVCVFASKIKESILPALAIFLAC